MTEDQARQVVLLQAQETAPENPHWSMEDRAWATRQALATVGDSAAPEVFVSARATLALQRLLPRDRTAQRWLARRGWHTAGPWLAVLIGLAAGVGMDQLMPSQRVNLLAPAVWAVVAWNLVVYLGLLWPGSGGALQRWLAAWGTGRAEGATALWLQHAWPLTLKRSAVLLHAAAAALGLGLMAGLYLRGLVLDYRAGWESTFLDAATVQRVLEVLLAPASAVNGIAVPDVAPLQLAPGAPARASAAPWIHLYGATLLLAVVLPRAALALWAAARARWLAGHFALPLDTPYFETLAPLMQPHLPRALRLLWAAPDRIDLPLRLLGTAVPQPLTQPLLLLQSDEGDQLMLHPAPLAELQAGTEPAPAAPWWQPWRAVRDPAQQLLARLQASTEAVVLLLPAGEPRPAWLAALGRPVVVLAEGRTGTQALAHTLGLHDLDDGWLRQGRLLQALVQALPGDARLVRLQQSWQRREQARFDAGMAVLADILALAATTRIPLADHGLLARRADADAARAALAEALQGQWLDAQGRLAAWSGRLSSGRSVVVAADAAAPSAALHKRLGEGRAAMIGGVLTGTLAGLKADLLSGGLTMGAGMVAGGVLGALGAAGVARGLNVVRGSDLDFAAWDETAMALITQTLLQQFIALERAPDEAAALERLAPALQAAQPRLAPLWRGRHRGSAPEGEVPALAGSLQPVLAEVVKGALGGP